MATPTEMRRIEAARGLPTPAELRRAKEYTPAALTVRNVPKSQFPVGKPGDVNGATQHLFITFR